MKRRQISMAVNPFKTSLSTTLVCDVLYNPQTMEDINRFERRVSNEEARGILIEAISGNMGECQIDTRFNSAVIVMDID